MEELTTSPKPKIGPWCARSLGADLFTEMYILSPHLLDQVQGAADQRAIVTFRTNRTSLR